MLANRDGRTNRLSRVVSLVAALATVCVALLGGSGPPRPARAAAADRELAVTSPDGRVRFLLKVDAGRLNYAVTLGKKSVLESAPLGIILDRVHLGQGVELGEATPYRVNERYPWRGVHAEAVNHANGTKIALTHTASKTRYTLEVRAYDSGVAFRFIVPGAAGLRVPDEATAFRLPAGSIVWHHDHEGHYEGVHTRSKVEEVKTDQWAVVPLTAQLPDGVGYVSITEAALRDYSGLVLQADGKRGFVARLGHAPPISYPFRLRYGVKEGERLAKPAAITGTITTPWRVVMVGADLNALVNCDLVHNVSAPPDPKLFPKGMATEWLRPGRCVWRYLDGGETTLAAMKEFSRLAGELGFEHHLVEGFWRRWSEKELRELVDYSRKHRVGIWLWKHRRDIRDAEQRRQFFKMCQEAGVVGVKLDFFDHEAKEVIDLYQDCLRDAAACQLMVNFHGANKPAGEARTWPNEMTREGIFGLEYRKMKAWARHNTTVPFTRMLAGHADYTPVHFGERRRETSAAHQIATAAVLTSPLLVYGAHPKTLLDHPAAEIIRSIQSVWDETIALPQCVIGELVVFARRRGDTWFLAVLNGGDARSLRVPLTFLGPAVYQTLAAHDQGDDPSAIRLETARASRKDALKIELRPAGGFIARFSPTVSR
jgi:alpha-glucosidase